MTRNISIVIPFFQKQEALKKTWGELYLQISPDDEVLVVDDHSPDGVPDLGCPCIKVIQPPKHVPHIYRLNTLRNLGVEHATNDAIMILDPDCIPTPRFLDHARRIYDPSILFAGWINRIDKKGDIREDRRINGGGSRWIDRTSRDCRNVLGGCMYFSKRRASLVRLFDTSFDGSWGSEEHAFASACYNSGMRLRLEKELMVYHQWHEKNRPGNIAHNRQLFNEKSQILRESLNYVTPYKPAVAVLMVSTMRPYYIDQGMRAIFRHAVPFKVRLVNNGDQSSSQLNAVAWWSDRWAVDYVNYKSPELLSTIRSNAIRDYNEKKYTYLITMDDDITPMNGSLTTLISEMETHPEYHALSGYIVDWKDQPRFIGGKIKAGIHYYYYPVKPETMPADYISSGFTIIRLDKVVPYSEGWEMGWNDWDWSNEIRKRGLLMGVTGKAGAYHRQLFTTNGREQKKDSAAYKEVRYDRQRHNRMAEKFKEKWGYTPKPARRITEMKV